MNKKYRAGVAGLLLALWMLMAAAPGCHPGDHAAGQPTVNPAQSRKVRLMDVSEPGNLSAYLDSAGWDSLFPHRYTKGKKGSGDYFDLYSFYEFRQACGRYPAFLGQGDATVQKRELAAFLANMAQETSGGWAEAPGGYFKWGLYFIQERDTTHDYWDTTRKAYPPVAGQKYFGRGIMQLSGNYNYGQFSEAWFGSPDNLLQHPEYVAGDPALNFTSGLWFWMTPQYPKPSCHDIMTGKWRPTAIDSAGGRLPGFGATVNVINGGVECGKGRNMEETANRYQYYRYFCNYFHVSPGDHIECADQKPFGQ